MHEYISIVAVDVVNLDYAQVKSIVLDLHRYTEWWSAFHAKAADDGQSFTFSPLSGVRIRMAVEKVTPNSILLHYVSGPFTGQGEWVLEPKGEHQTAVTYTIRIRGKNIFIRWLIQLNAFRRRHIRDILRLIRRLEAMQA